MKRAITLVLMIIGLVPMSLAQSPYVNDVLALNPLGYWRLDGNANDSSVNSNNGALRNGLIFTGLGGGPPIGDPSNQAAIFNITQDQYITMPTTASAPVFALDGNHPVSMVVWVKTNYAVNDMLLLDKKPSNGVSGPGLRIDNGDFGFAPKGSGRFGMTLDGANNTSAYVTTSLSVNDNNWHFLVGTYDGSGQAGGIRLYVDGVAVQTIVAQNNLSGTILNNVPVTIGARDTGTAPFNGLLAEAAIFGAVLTPAQVQQLANDTAALQKIMPQFAFGGGWYSALYFTNTGPGAVSIPISFTADDGTPLTVPSVGGSSTTVNLPPLGTAIVEAPNLGPLNQGYVSATLQGGVVGYGIFRQSIAGIADQEAVVPVSGVFATSSTLIWDDTAFITGVAVVNLGSAPSVVSITVRDGTGTTIGAANISLPAKGKRAFFLKDLPGLGAIAGKRGSANFTASIGNIAVLGLRFNGSAITSIPTADR